MTILQRSMVPLVADEQDGKEDAMSRFTLDLSDPNAVLATAGGKGASLARMSTAGRPVVDGFHVTTESYVRFVRENSLQKLVLAAADEADPASPESLDRASSLIAREFAQAPVPDAVATAVRLAYGDLCSEEPVAVRSSATAEDLPGASFAGQQESFLNVRGADAVLEAIVKCWASLWTARAISYRIRHGIDHGLVSMAVLVQRWFRPMLPV